MQPLSELLNGLKELYCTKSKPCLVVILRFI